MAKITKECKCCGKEFKANRKRRKYCSQECSNNAQRTGEYLECEYCGEEFYVKKSHVNEAKFCSKECKDKSRKAGEYIHCENCGEEFYVPPRQLGERKYCSWECSKTGEYKECAFCGKKIYVQDKDLNEKNYCSRQCYGKDIANGKYTKCLNCGQKFYVSPNRVEQAKYCSWECRTEHMTGDNHPTWQGGGIECKCEVCGKVFKLYKHEIKDGGGKCCSRKCLNKWYGKPENMTDIEKKVYDVLNDTNIEFETQKQVNRYRFDFYLPDYNLIIEADGDYWHGNPDVFDNLNKKQKERSEIDKQRDIWCKNKGYNIERIWGSDIKEDAEKYVKRAIRKYQTNESKVVSL